MERHNTAGILYRFTLGVIQCRAVIGLILEADNNTRVSADVLGAVDTLLETLERAADELESALSVREEIK